MASSLASLSPDLLALSLAALTAGLPAQRGEAERRAQSRPASAGPVSAGPVSARASAASRAAQAKRPKDLAALFEQFRSMRGMSAAYTEEKHLSLLAVPLKSKGALHYMTDADGAHGRLVRLVKEPEPSKLTVTGRELRIADKHGAQVIDLRQSDRVRLFVTSLMHVFQGDGASLQRHYAVRYIPDAEQLSRWRLELTPKKAPLDKILKQLALHGAGEAVTQIVLTEPNGDRTVTKIHEADPRRVFSSQERREIFDLATPEPKPARK
jgi:hypothetical protein